MEDINITIKGGAGTGKSTLAVLLEEFLIKKGFDVKLDLESEILDYGNVDSFRHRMLENKDVREKAVAEKTKIVINQVQITRSLDFSEVVEPFMDYLAGFHPHTTAIVTQDNAEILEGVMCHKTKKFIRD